MPKHHPANPDNHPNQSPSPTSTPSSTLTDWVDVVVGVLIDQQGQFLFAQRPEGKPMAGYWEFPGGKVEANETHFEALYRELKEELDLEIQSATNWKTIEYSYPHAHVKLHFLICRSWVNQAKSLENQSFDWIKLDPDFAPQHFTIQGQPLLPATLPLLPELAKMVAISTEHYNFQKKG